MNKSKIILAAYGAAVAADLLAIFQQMDEIRLISKSVLMPLLMVYAISKFQNKKSALFAMLTAGLVLSWVGDLFLLFDNAYSSYFIFGLIGFLIAHICYIFAYQNAKLPNTETALLPTQQIRYLFILTLAGSAVIYVLYPHLDQLKLPVIIYAIVLVGMAIAALYRFGRTSSASFTLVFVGALLFMLSDSMLAINKFVDSFLNAGIWVMLTYSLAQYFIVEGLAKHDQLRLKN